MSELIRTLREATAAFDRLAIPYALMGGLAVRVYGLPRPTYDIDFAIAAGPAQLTRLFAELEKLHYTIPEPYRRGWMDSVAGMQLFKCTCLPTGSWQPACLGGAGAATEREEVAAS